MSETASHAWSTDVLACVTDDEQAETLSEFDQDDMCSGSELGPNLDDVRSECDAAEGGDIPPLAAEMQNFDVRGRGRSIQSHRGARGGHNMNRGRGAHFGTEQGREDYGWISGRDENIDIICGEDGYVDRNRGRGGHDMNRGRDGHDMNMGRGGHDMPLLQQAPQPIHPRGQNRRRGRQPTRDNYQKQTMDTKENLENEDHRENNQRGRSYGRRARGRERQQNRHRTRGNVKVTEPSSKEDSKIVADSASQTFLCEQFVIGQCRNQSCRLLHSNRPRLPYVWQVKLYNVWVNIDQSETVEMLFCEDRGKECHVPMVNLHIEQIDEIGMSQTITICFEPDISGVSSSGDKLSARRLSTKSYAAPKVKAGSFVTRWLWYWRDDMGSWQLFDTDAMQYTLESKFLYGQANFLYSRDNYRFKYALNFTGMQQLNLDTYKVRKITRRPTFVSGNDVKSENMSVLHRELDWSKAPFLQSPSLFMTNCRPSKDRLVSKPTAPVPLPSGWAPWDLAHPFELVELDPGHPDYIDVENSFFLTLLRHNEIIDNIYRVQCPALWNKFCSHRKSMVAAAKRAGRGANIDERKLFHATDCLDTVRGICINNFDPRLSGKNGTTYGDGAYFAKNSKYSHAYSGKDPSQRFVFQAIVLTGDFVVGDSSYRRPPGRPEAAHELYDSCVNNIDNPHIFVIFDRDQYYPEYLIQYHDRPRSPEPVKRSAPVRPRVPAVASGYTSGTRSGSTTQSGSFQLTSSSSSPALSYPRATAVSYPTHQVSYPATNPVSYPSGNTSSHPATSPVSYPTTNPVSYPSGNTSSYPATKKEKKGCCIQ